MDYDSGSQNSKPNVSRVVAFSRASISDRDCRKRDAQNQFREVSYADKVGAFEGAMYETKGYYRPQQQCIMISGNHFCAVCRHAIEDIIDLYSKPE